MGKKSLNNAVQVASYRRSEQRITVMWAVGTGLFLACYIINFTFDISTGYQYNKYTTKMTILFYCLLFLVSFIVFIYFYKVSRGWGAKYAPASIRLTRI